MDCGDPRIGRSRRWFLRATALFGGRLAGLKSTNSIAADLPNRLATLPDLVKLRESNSTRSLRALLGRFADGANAHIRFGSHSANSLTEHQRLSQSTLASVKKPNRNGFIPDNRANESLQRK
jgi:hypothetical protein